MVGPAAIAVEAAKRGLRNGLKEEDVVPGRIVWMPWAGVIRVTYHSRHKGKGDGVQMIGQGTTTRPRRRAWNHPAVIIKRSGDEVFILPITSLRYTRLDDKYDGKTKRGQYLQRGMMPISPADRHPFWSLGDKRYVILEFVNRSRMHMPGYVNLRTVYKMEWQDLEQYRKSNMSKFQLDHGSLEALMTLFHAVNPNAGI